MERETRLRAALGGVLSGIAFAVTCLTSAGAGEAPPLPGEILRLAQQICEKDRGRLWGVSLCGPVLLVNPETREAFANQPDAEGQLKKEGEVYTGTLPPEVNLANTATTWSGVKWTMLLLPLPANPELRATLLAHEMWHRVQDTLKLPAANPSNDHLDARDGRYWLQLEWRALAAALASSGSARNLAIVDATCFRNRRRQLFPGAGKSELALEMNEGLAEYTGVKLSGSSDLPRFVREHELTEAPEKNTFVRSFAYATGPAYGVLLDEVARDWRKNLRPNDDLAELLLQRSGLKAISEAPAAMAERAQRYGADPLAVAEDTREEQRRTLVLAYRARLIDEPVLNIPLRNMNMQFDPGNLMPLDTHGTVYPNIRIVDDWGVLTVSRDGALMNSDFTRVTVSAPTDAKMAPTKGDGWTLELKSGWEIRPGQRPGDYVVGAKE